MNRDEAIKALRKAGNISVAHAEDLYDSIVPKPVVPQFVVDWVNDSREWDYDFEDWFDCDNQSEEVCEWLNCRIRSEAELNALALATLIVHGPVAVTVKEEKRYTVRIRNLADKVTYLNYDNFRKTWMFYSRDNTDRFRTHHTRKELEEGSFGWVFDCEGVEVKEVD